MSHRYTIVTAKTFAEAIQKSPFFVGQKAQVEEVNASPNGDGTWSVFAEFQLNEPKPTYYGEDQDMK